MDQRTIAQLALGMAFAACLAVVGCSKDATPSAASNAATSATPSPFALRSSRLIEAPAAAITPAMIRPTPGAGESDESYDPVSVSVDGDPDSGGVPLTVTLSAEVTGGPPGMRYRWDFGDHSPPAHQLTVQHTYQTAGDYTATFSVTGPDVDESQDVSITANQDAFDLDVDADPDIGPAPLTTNFAAVLDEDLPGPFYFQWDFGDGARDASNPTNHTYRSPGEYTATLKVTNAQGQSATHDVDIQVDPPDDSDN